VERESRDLFVCVTVFHLSICPTRSLATTYHSTKGLSVRNPSNKYHTEPFSPTTLKMFISLIIRPLQLISAAIVLALSIGAAKWQIFETVPATTTYAAFAGGFTLLISLIGIASIWISAIPALIMSMVDILASVLLLAGGVVSP